MLYALLFIVGASWGSFLNVVALRTQEHRQFVRGRSSCAHCGANIGWYDMIPVVSWLALGGKCRMCRARLSRQYVLAELATGAAFVLGAFVAETPLEAGLYLSVVSFFMVLFICDATAYMVPDAIVVPAIVVIGALNAVLHESPIALAWGALAGGAWFLAQFLVSRGRWVGGGDIRIGMLMGVLLGHPLVWLGLGVAYVGGSAIAVPLLAAKRVGLKSKLPFATILLPATFAVWIWGAPIWDWYTGIIGL